MKNFNSFLIRGFGLGLMIGGLFMEGMGDYIFNVFERILIICIGLIIFRLEHLICFVKFDKKENEEIEQSRNILKRIEDEIDKKRERGD